MEAVVLKTKYSQGIGTETQGMDYVFPPDDLWFGSDNKNCNCIVLLYI